MRMNYPAIAGHLEGRGHAIAVEAIEEAELRARVRLDADLARGASTDRYWKRETAVFLTQFST